MNDIWAQQVQKRLSEGTLDNAFKLPDAKYLGDPFFITDSKGLILAIFVWNGKDGWFRDDATFLVQK